MFKLVQFTSLATVLLLAACSGGSSNSGSPSDDAEANLSPNEVSEDPVTGLQSETDLEPVAPTDTDTPADAGMESGSDSGAVTESMSDTDAGTVNEPAAGTDTGTETGTNADNDASSDSDTSNSDDTSADAGSDDGSDDGNDAGTDAGTADGNDLSSDAGTDAGSDSGVTDSEDTDSGTDAGTDSGPEEPEAPPQAPEEPELPPRPPEGPESSEEPETPEGPETTDAPESPEAPETPEGPESPEGPIGPESPEGPIGPESPEGPETPGGPEGPENPDGGSIPGQDLIGDTVVENFATTQGISLDINRFATNQSGSPQLELKLNNNSSTAIFNTVCELTALQGDQNMDVASTTFANGGPIDSGESAINIGDFTNLADGYSSISTIRIGCEWSDGDNGRRDIVNGAVTVSFTGYSSNSGRPTVRLMLTNNSAETINMAVCGVEAKRLNVIADVATVEFAELGDISSGAAVEATGIWSKLNSLDEFDSDPFNIANVNCQYQ